MVNLFYFCLFHKECFTFHLRLKGDCRKYNLEPFEWRCGPSPSFITYCCRLQALDPFLGLWTTGIIRSRLTLTILFLHLPSLKWPQIVACSPGVRFFFSQYKKGIHKFKLKIYINLNIEILWIYFSLNKIKNDLKIRKYYMWILLIF